MLCCRWVWGKAEYSAQRRVAADDGRRSLGMAVFEGSQSRVEHESSLQWPVVVPPFMQGTADYPIRVLTVLTLQTLCMHYFVMATLSRNS